MAVEVFKTNITDLKVANEVLLALKALFPSAQINFDLDDCDKILSVKSSTTCCKTIVDTLMCKGFYCEVLD